MLSRTVKSSKFFKLCGHQNRQIATETIVGAMAIGTLGTFAYVHSYWKTVLPHQRLVVTGFGIKGAYVGQTKLLLPKPLHQWYPVSLQVHTQTFDVITFTKDKIALKLPIVLTTTPDTSIVKISSKTKLLYDDQFVTVSSTDSPAQTNEDFEMSDRFQVYLEKYGGMDTEERDKIFENDVGTEIRSSAGNMEAEVIARDKDAFKKLVTESVKRCLFKSGVSVVNLGVSELLDGPKSNFFTKLGERAEQSANRDALVATSEHENKTEMEQTKFTSEKRKEVALKNMEALLVENANKEKEVESKRKLDVFNAEQDKQSRIAKLQASFEADMKEIDYKKQVEESRRAQIIEAQKSEYLSPAIVAKEKLTVDTDAQAYQIRTLAEAKLYEQELKAKGDYAILEANANGILKQVEALGGDPGKYIANVLASKGEYSNIARELSNGLKGTNPIIFAKGGHDSSSTISETITDVTGAGLAFAKKFKDETGVDILGALLQSKSDNSFSKQA